MLSSFLSTLEAMTPAMWFNAVLAAVGAVVAFGASNRMNKSTECTVIVAFATLGSGLVGYAIGTFLPDNWEQAFDTLLLGGAAALMIGSRKQTMWVAPTWMPRISLGVSIATWIAFFTFV